MSEYKQKTTSIKNTSTKSASVNQKRSVGGSAPYTSHGHPTSLGTGSKTGSTNGARAGYSGTGHPSTLKTGTKC
jgi:hypothetical protein